MTTPTFTPDELQRYKRHIVLKDVGAAGQQKLKAAKVLLVGAGGLGSPIALYLAAAGVGTIGVVDDDVVSLSNLQRQIIHTTAGVGRPKTISAAESMLRINPHIVVEQHLTRLTANNAIDLISRYDVVADGSDNFATRYLVSDACFLARKVLVFGAVGPFDGYVSTFKPHLRDGRAIPYPSYRCLFPTAPAPGSVANCSEVGVLGAVVGVIGTLQATEVLKEILQIGESLAGRLLIWDTLSATFQELKIAWDEDNPLSGRHATIIDLSSHATADQLNCAT